MTFFSDFVKRWGEPGVALVSLVAVIACARWGVAKEPSSKQWVGDIGGVPSASKPSRESTGGQPEKTETPALTEAAPADPLAGEASKLATWSRALSELRAGTRKEPLRILWFGDSHTAADYWTSAVRKVLAEDVPLAGPGYLSLGVPNYRHGMAKLWRDGTMELSPHPPARRSQEDDGIFGLSGTRVTLKDSTAVVSLRLTFDGVNQSKVDYELFYRTRSKSDRLTWNVGSERREIGPGDGETLAGGIRTFRFEADGSHTVEIRALGGTPQLYGLVVETKTPGFVIDTLGINGARFGTFLAWEKEAFAAVVAERKPLIAVVAYGTNEVYDDESVVRHAKRLEQVVERLRSAVPDIGCVVAGPTDVGKGGEAATTRIVALDQAERITAERLGCLYFSAYDVMAKEGGFTAWSQKEPPLSLSDGIHLTARGYTRLGEALARQCFSLKTK